MDIFEDFDLTGLTEPIIHNPLSDLKVKLHSLYDEHLTKDDLLRNYEETYRIRHDYTHKLICNFLNIEADLGTSKSVFEHFPNVHFKKRMHPDIVCEKNGYVIIGDVSVSNDVNWSRQHKIDKYKQICQEIKDQKNTEVIFITFIVKPSLNNLHAEILEIVRTLDNIGIHLDDQLFDKGSLTSFFYEVDSVQEKIRELINDDTMISYHLKTKYSTEDIFPEGKPIEDFPPFKNDVLQNLHDYKFKNESETIELLKELMDDATLMKAVSEKETKPEDFMDAYEWLKLENSKFKVKEPTPSIYTPLVGMTSQDLIPSKIEHSTYPLEQRSILNLFSFIKNNFELTDCPETNFINDLVTQTLAIFSNDPQNINYNLFTKSVYFSEEKDKEERTKYHEMRQKMKKKKDVGTTSFLDFLKKQGKVSINENDSRAIRVKTVKIPHNKLSKEGRLFYDKAHVGTQKEKKEIEINKQKKTINLSEGEEIESFLDHLMEKSIIYPETTSVFEDFLFASPGYDIDIFNKIKSTSVNIMKDWINVARQYNIYNYMKIQSLLNEQLMHFLQFSCPNNQYALFNSGLKNMCYAMPIGYQNKGNDAGKAFMCFGVTDTLSHIRKIYGKVLIKKTRVNGANCYLYIYNWRRLTAERANFLRDHYYTVLSTSLGSLMRKPKPSDIPHDILYKKIRRTFCVRSVLHLSCSQIVAERSADMKNIIMHAFSEYSNVFELIIDKFKPPFKNHTEAWIVSRLEKVVDLCKDYQSGNCVHLRQPIYIGHKRMVESLGGKLNLTSVWSDDLLQDTQDLLDDLFLYVHTPKEPSSIHHENIKAIETILKFQNQFDKIPQEQKNGEFLSLMGLKDFLMQPTSIGFHKDILHNSVKYTLNKMNLRQFPDQIKNVINEDLLEISSTKSCIPELKRKIIDENKTKDRNKKREKIEKEFKDPKEFPIVDEDLRLITEKGYVYEKNSTNRMKVHDTILDFSETYNKNYTKTIELAMWNIQENSSRVATDICIKAQYGAKREFYVVNLGAKAMVRLFENTYKSLCKLSNNEMISVPGDKKLLHMQDKVNKLLLTKSKGKLIYSVNGDCTKWSAAETLQAFDVMSFALKDIVSDNHLKFLRQTCYAWANKLIYTPISLIKNFKFKTEKTSYLTKDVMGIHSTQNFLQGMFNYSSSFKAVCCSNYTVYLWKKICPWSTIEVDHLEHSDDYLLLLKVSNKDELLQFRRFHRIMMKMHGFNDSIKKTNTQRLLTEFISLIAFNGQMTYPQIKKTKEVGMNTSCAGFKDDMDTALSRAAEALRIGVDQVTAYAMQRIHQLNILRSYSLLPNMQNNMWSISESFNIPVELFGVPDILPSIYMLTTGNCNNYRLYRFREYVNPVNIEKTMKHLFRQSFWALESTSGFIEDSTLSDKRLYSPRYTYDQENKSIHKIRSRLKISYEESAEFLMNHKSYNFMKPRTYEDIRQWMHALYYKPNFAIAYSRMSRAQLTLRLSRLTKTSCILHPQHGFDKLMTLKQYANYMIDIVNNTRIDNWTDDEEKLFNRVIISNDPTIELLYSMMEDSHIAFRQEDYKVLTASVLPVKPTWLNIANPVTSLFQYIFNKDDFIKDNRKYKGLTSLSRDKEMLENMYGLELNSSCNNSIHNAVFRDLIQLNKPQPICMSYTTSELKFEDFVKIMFEHQIITGIKFDLILVGTSEARNPYTSELYFRKQQLFTKDQVRLCVDDMLIVYGFLKHTCKLDKIMIKQYFRQLYYNDKLLGTKFPCLKLLQNYGFNSFVNTEPKPYELKAYCFLKWVLLEDPEATYSLLNHISSYSYRYFKPKSNKFEEACYIKYQNSSFIALKLHESEQTDSDIFKRLIIVGDSIKKYKLSMAFLIGLRLFSLISNNLFDTKLGEVSISQIKSINSNIANLVVGELKDSELSFFDERWDVTNIEYVNSTDDLKPFFYTPNIDIYSSLKLGELPQNLTLDEENSTIMIGSLKYFTAPYLQCKQVGILTSEGDLKPIKGLKFEWWIQQSRIQDLLHQNIDKIKYADVIDYIDIESLDLNEFWVQATYKRILASLEFNDKNKYAIVDTINKEEIKDEQDETFAANLMSELEMSGFSLDDLELDFGDELLGDEQLIRNDTMEYEDTSGSSTSDDKKYVEYRTLDEFTKTIPYFIQETNVTFSLTKPRSLDYLEFANKSIERLIYESSKTSLYLFNVRPFHKLILFTTYLENYKKWVNSTNVKEIQHNKLSMFLLYKVCEELLDTNRDFKVDYINEEYAVIQNDRKLLLTYYVSNPDIDDIQNVKDSNSYYLTNNNLYLGHNLLSADLPIDKDKEEVYVLIDEGKVKDFVSAFNIFSALGFVQKKWVKYYNLIETEFRTLKKQRLRDIIRQRGDTSG